MKVSIYQSPLFRTTASAIFVAIILSAIALLWCADSRAQNVSVIEVASRPSSPDQKRVFVRSKALLVRAAVVEEKLLKRPEFSQLGFAITRDESSADIIIELRHDLLTKYVYTVIDTRTQTVLAGGKVSSLGGTVAGKVAKQFVKEMARRTP